MKMEPLEQKPQFIPPVSPEPFCAFCLRASPPNEQFYKYTAGEYAELRLSFASVLGQDFLLDNFAVCRPCWSLAQLFQDFRVRCQKASGLVERIGQGLRSDSDDYWFSESNHGVIDGLQRVVQDQLAQIERVDDAAEGTTRETDPLSTEMIKVEPVEYDADEPRAPETAKFGEQSFVCFQAVDPISVKREKMGDSDTDSDCPMDADAAATSDGMIPEKSRALYETTFKRFQDWQVKNQALSTDEPSLLAYFSQELGNKKPSTKWSLYSMLRTMINLRIGIDIGGFVNLKSFLKRKSDGYCPKKSKILTKEEIFRFLREADDSMHLVTKVALIIGVYGACRRDELLKLTLEDIEDQEDSIKITIPNAKTHAMRQFLVTKGTAPGVDMLQLFRSYAGKRAAGTNHSRFFVSYRSGKCTKQAIGINTIAKLPKMIAEYLKLPSPELYTSHCFRRSSASLLADSGVDISVLKRHSGWKS